MKFAQRSLWLNLNLYTWFGKVRVHGTDDFGTMIAIRGTDTQAIPRPYGFEIVDYGM